MCHHLGGVQCGEELADPRQLTCDWLKLLKPSWGSAHSDLKRFNTVAKTWRRAIDIVESGDQFRRQIRVWPGHSAGSGVACCRNQVSSGGG